MKEQLKEYEKTIRTRHRLGWTPKYEEEFRYQQDKKYFPALVVKAFDDLGWDLLYQDDTVLEAKRQGEFNRWTEKITVTYDAGRIRVRSVSLGNEMWDMGRNSKRVKLFIHAFKTLLENVDKISLSEIKEEWDALNNWDDYVVPESLPQPSPYREPNARKPLFGGILLGVLLGYFLAILMREGMYVIGLFEVGVAFFIMFVYKYLIRWGNYPWFPQLNKMILLTIILTYFCKEFFYYRFITEQLLLPVDFFTFLQMRLGGGLPLQNVDELGWLGFLLGKAAQIGFTWLFTFINLNSTVTNYILKRTPREVTDFAWYLFVKNKTEEEVRAELASKGWTQKENQDEVFDSIGIMHHVHEMSRME